jgi:DNA-binding response OmpR family regulator
MRAFEPRRPSQTSTSGNRQFVCFGKDDMADSFGERELLARIHAVLRYHQPLPERSDDLIFFSKVKLNGYP